MRGSVERPAGLLGGLAEVAGLATARPGELVDLVCDDRETAAVHAGARCFDRGVEREQVRLVRNEADRFRELLDLLRHVAQAPHLAGTFFGGHAEIGEAMDGGLGCEADLLGGLFHLRARVAGLGPGGGYLAGVLGQLLRVAGQRAHEARGLGSRLAGATRGGRRSRTASPESPAFASKRNRLPRRSLIAVSATSSISFFPAS